MAPVRGAGLPRGATAPDGALLLWRMRRLPPPGAGRLRLQPGKGLGGRRAGGGRSGVGEGFR